MPEFAVGGAEIDKILSILAVTAILGLSLVRARELIARSIAEEMAIRDLSRFFAPEVAEQIRHAEGDTGSMRCDGCRAAILMTDLRGFTALSHGLLAQELIALLADYQSRLSVCGDTRFLIPAASAAAWTARLS